MYFLIFLGIVILYFAIRIFIGSRKMEFYGDSIKKNSSNPRDEAYQKSAQHSQQATNANNHTGGGGGPSA
ncbi:hypothetical protein N5C46_21135 [Rossellomorea vietnamensis]|uniref:Uncharacterized protein n=1 Tax=Rossellomorea vietnamensis TaxID=218284 RepID=A0ACD4C6U3_9BACI|nr:hypothetical protein [Rossellomorea vietnamensis]UXH44109.1 hypothetical protein N5C46_21135 [Rossellomorea vietnamensis]